MPGRTRAMIAPAVLFLLAGLAFVVAGYMGHQVAFYGVAAAFLGVSVMFSVIAGRAKGKADRGGAA